MTLRHTVEFKIQHGDYFLAALDNGWIGVGILALVRFDFPPGHAEFDRVSSLTAENIEEVCDEFYAKQMI